MFLDKGFRIAVLPDPNGKFTPYIKHTGGAVSVANAPLDPMPKILIAIPVCHEFKYGEFESSESPHYKGGGYEGKPYGTDIHISGPNARIAALRDTWLKDVAKFPNVEYKLFYGEGATRAPESDEVFLSCPDDYRGLPAKTIAICRYAKEHGYDLLFKCDDDTGVYVDRILHEALSYQFDYAGYINGRVCTGGTGYWLSRRAINVMAEKATSNYSWAEDVTVSHFLYHHDIQAVSLPGHKTGRSDHWFFKDGFDPKIDMSGISAFHAVRPADMRAWYASVVKT